MKWAVAVALMVGSSMYLYRRYMESFHPTLAIPERVAPVVKPPSILSPADLEKIRKSARSGPPEVRATALELLFTLADPTALALLDNAVAHDPDPAVRLKAVTLLRNRSSM